MRAEPVVPVPTVPSPYLARPLDYPDVRAVYELTALCEEHDLGTSEVEFEDIDSDWARPSLEPARDDLGIFLGDELVAYAEVYKGFRAEVQVHPGHRGRGLGAVLLQWSEEQARAVGGTEVGQTISDTLTGAAALLQAHGYSPRWTSWALDMDLSWTGGQAAPVPLELNPPYRLRDANLRSEPDVRAAYQVIEDAFNEWPNRPASAFEDWRAMTVGREGFEAWQLPLMVTTGRDGGEDVVGAAVLTRSFGGTGWVHQLAVRQDHRGYGLAKALLHHARTVFAAHGESTMGLSTDSRTGALGLYEHVGMRVRLSFTSWARRLDTAAAE